MRDNDFSDAQTQNETHDRISSRSSAESFSLTSPSRDFLLPDCHQPIVISNSEKYEMTEVFTSTSRRAMTLVNPPETRYLRSHAVTFETGRFRSCARARFSSTAQVKRIEQGDELIYFHFRRNSTRSESHTHCARGIHAEWIENIQRRLVLHL